jgi:hypothetical protein
MAKLIEGEEGASVVGYVVEGEEVTKGEYLKSKAEFEVSQGDAEYSLDEEYNLDGLEWTSASTAGKDNDQAKDRIISSVCCDFSHAEPAYVSELISFLTDMDLMLEAEKITSELVHELAEERITVDELELVELSLEEELDSVTKGNVTIIRSGGGIDIKGEMRDKTIASSVVDTFSNISSDYYQSHTEDMSTGKITQSGSSLSRKLQNISIDDFSISFSDDS